MRPLGDVKFVLVNGYQVVETENVNSAFFKSYIRNAMIFTAVKINCFVDASLVVPLLGKC